MKERSVAFYKRLIIFAALSIIIVIVGLLTFLVGGKLNLWEKKPVAERPETTVAATDEKKVTGSAIKEERVTVAAAISDNLSETERKVVYLTFDDGSSGNTSQILEILKENRIKATFFFNTSEKQTADSIIKETYDDGHAIGILTSSDYNYDTIYSSVDSYLEDFSKSYDRIYQITGQRPSILRFPGGSINAYDKDNYKALTEEVTKRDFVYFDWNVCADDGSGKASTEAMIKNGTKLPGRADKCIVLMHDNGNSNTCEALKEIIRFYRDSGYVFEKLTADVKPITFS